MKELYLLSIALMCFSNLSFAQVEATNEIQSKVLFQLVEQNVRVQPLLRNATPFVKGLTYVVLVEKSGDTNSSSASKRGRLVMQPGDIANLSASTQNLLKGEKLTVDILVYEKDTILIHQNSKEYQLKEVNSQREAVNFFDERISGIVIDNTKTKLGNDFYNEYYNRYQQLYKDNKETAYVEETPPIGRTTLVTVKIGNREVFKARTQPGYDYLDNLVKQALARTELYLKTQKNNINSLKIY